MPKYILSREAEADLEQIATFTDEHWGTLQATHYITALRTACELLVSKPEMGRPCGSIRRGLYRLECSSHVIFYRRTREGIFVSRFLHKRMLPTPARLTPRS